MNDLMSGISIAIAPKFSLKGFWSDVIESDSTVFVYGKRSPPLLNLFEIL